LIAGAGESPVALEFDELVPSELRELIEKNVPLSDAQMDAMIDAVILGVQKSADERPVIFSAFLPLRRVRQRFFNAFDDKTIVRLVCDRDGDGGDGDGDDDAGSRERPVLRRESTMPSAFDAVVYDESGVPPPPPPSSRDVVVVPEIDDQYDRSWRATGGGKLGLEALAMLEKVTDEALRSNRDAADETRMRLRLAWLHGKFEDIEPEHVEVTATRSLHDVARDVRLMVSQSILRCSKRKKAATAPDASTRLVDVGGISGVLRVAAIGAVVGGVVSLVRTMK
jgi:hypothetical protein